jgi:O-acetyl-ADP-ribose deacetylase (regulator of RNase III)
MSWSRACAERRKSSNGKVRQEGAAQGQAGDARAEGRQAPQWLRQTGQEPQAGDCDRSLRGAPLRRESATQAEVLAQEEVAPGRLFEVVRGDLLQEPVDAIVNAANGALAHGGGVAGIIARAAGPALQAESDAAVRTHGYFATGSAVATGAGKLPFKGVIHAVGPRYGEDDEEMKLMSALIAAFELAKDRGWETVSFPAVSAGIFAVPLEICARAYVKAGRASPLRKARLCLRDQPIIDAVLREMSK